MDKYLFENLVCFWGEGIQCQPKNSCGGHYNHNYLATKNLKNATLFSSLISRTIPLEEKLS